MERGKYRVVLSCFLLLMTLTAGTGAILGSSVQEGFHHIALNDSAVFYDGVFFPDVSADRVVFNRHKSEIIAHPESGISLTSAPFARTQSGVRIRLRTDSPQIRFTFSERTDAGLMGLNEAFAIYTGSDYAGSPHAIYNTLQFTVEAPSGSGGPVTYTVILPSLHGVDLTGIELLKGYSLEMPETDNRPVYAVIGNSIAHGTGHQSASFRTWPFILAAEQGWQLYNLAVAGARSGWPVATLMRGKKVDFITVSTGFNDWMWDNKTLDVKKTQYGALLDSLRALQPDAVIFCLTPIQTTQTSPNLGAAFTLADLRGAISEVVTTRSEDDPRLNLIHGDSISAVSMLMDGIHLSAAGARQFALNLSEKISETTATSLHENDVLPEGNIQLYQNYPNPFNPTTVIRYALKQQVVVRLSVHDVLGREIAVLLDQAVQPGDHSIRFDGNGLAGGMYIYRLKTGDVSRSRSMLLIR